MRGPTTEADRHRPEPTAAVDAAIRPALPTNRRRARSPAFSLHLFGRGYSLARRAHTGTRTTHALRRSVHYNSYSSARRCSNTNRVWSFRHSRPSPTFARRSSSARSFVRSFARRSSVTTCIRKKHFMIMNRFKIII